MKPRGGEGQNGRLKCPIGFLVFLVESSRELRKPTNFNTSGKWRQVGQALVVQKHFIRFHLNYKTIKLVFPLFLMVLDLTTREFDTTLHVDNGVIYISSGTGRKVFFCADISYGAYFSAVLVWLK